MSGSFSGTQPLNFVTNQKTSRTTTAQVVETESPKSETVPQDAPIIPPMPPPTIAHPRHSLKGQTTRRNIYETFGSALDFPSQSRPPDIMHMPSLPLLDLTTTPEAHLTTPENLRKRINSLAVDALVAAAQCHITAKDTPQKFAAHNALNLSRAAPEDSYSQPVATYAVAMVLNLSSSTQVSTFARGVNAGSFTSILHAARSDPEANTVEEDILNLHIYSTLVLLKLQQPQVEVERVRALIGEMENAIKDTVVRDSGLTKDSKTETNAGLDRVRRKGIYLSGLLFEFLPSGEWEGPIEMLRRRVRTLLESGELLPVGDYEHCIKPLDMDVPGLVIPAERRGQEYAVLQTWIDDFPLFPLAGSISNKTQW